MENYNNQNMFLDWDDAIEVDGQEFITLKEGDYNFRVVNFERSRFPGSAKLPACNKSVLTLEVDTPEGTASVKCDLIMYRTLEWKLSSFFRCIGHKKNGEKLVMDWNRAVGSQGRAHFKPRPYKDKNGNDRTANDVDYFIDYDPKFFADSTPDWVREAERQTQMPPRQTASVQQTQMPMNNGWKGGQF